MRVIYLRREQILYLLWKGLVFEGRKGSQNRCFHIIPLYTGGLFHMLDKSICHFRGVGAILLFSYSNFDGKSC